MLPYSNTKHSYFGYIGSFLEVGRQLSPFCGRQILAATIKGPSTYNVGKILGWFQYKHCSGVVIGCIYINQLQHNWYNTLIGLIIHYGQLYTKLYSVDIYNRLASHSYIQHQVISTPPRPTLNLLHQHSLAQPFVIIQSGGQLGPVTVIRDGRMAGPRPSLQLFILKTPMILYLFSYFFLIFIIFFNKYYKKLPKNYKSKILFITPKTLTVSFYICTVI